jgi:ATP-dependent DNA ligase
VRTSLRERARPGLMIIEPCLPSPAKTPGWLHEIKHDGIRIMARRDSAGVRLITRHATDDAGRISPPGVGGVRAASDSTECFVGKIETFSVPAIGLVRPRTE